jgi:hypothetical protein
MYKRIEDLSVQELDRIYSLSRMGEWTSPEIAHRHKIRENDVWEVVRNYDQLRELRKAKSLEEKLNQNPNPDPTTKKPRKRRCDARYATVAERQAAYRTRLKESRLVGTDQPSSIADAVTPGTTDEESSKTVSEYP